MLAVPVRMSIAAEAAAGVESAAEPLNVGATAAGSSSPDASSPAVPGPVVPTFRAAGAASGSGLGGVGAARTRRSLRTTPAADNA